MRRVLAVVVVLVAVGLAWLLLSGPPPTEAALAQGDSPAADRPAAATAAAAPAAPRTSPAAPSAADASTPLVDEVATARDGLLKVKVLADGNPVVNAAVRAYLRGATDPNTQQVDWRLAGTATSDVEGAAALPAKPGAYLVVARAHGFSPAFGDARRTSLEPVTRLTLNLAAGLALAGRTVSRGSGEAVPMASLTLTPALAGGSRFATAPDEEVVRAQSDARGLFRLEGLRPGDWAVQARAPAAGSGGVVLVHLPRRDELVVELAGAAFIQGFVRTATGAPAAGADVLASCGAAEPAVAVTSATGAFSLEVEPGSWRLSARRGAEAGALEAPVGVAAGKTAGPLELRLDASAGLEGLVVSAASQRPLGQVHVDVSPFDANGDVGRAVSGPDGRFTVERLAPGSYDAVASLDGYLEEVRKGVTVTRGQRFPLKLELRAAASVEGKVVDSRGDAVEGARVLAAYAYAQPSLETHTAPDGRYRLGGVTPGPVRVTARREGASFGPEKDLTVAEGTPATADFALLDDGVLTGRVTRKAGPLPDSALVRVRRQGPKVLRGSDFDSARPDEQGSYRLRLPPGQYGLSAFWSGDRASSWGDEVVTVAAGATVTRDLVLSDEAAGSTTFTVTVLDPAGAPAAGAMVRLSSPQASLVSAADEQGRLVSGMGKDAFPQGFSVDAWRDGCVGHARGSGEQRELTVQLEPAARVEGRLTGATPGASFTASAAPAQRGSPYGLLAPSREFTGDRFALDAAPGPTVVAVQTSDGRKGQATVTLVGGQTTAVEVTVR